jgi:hypothetical protein
VGYYKLVSSANKIGTDLSFINLGKSFINMRKSRNPKPSLVGHPVQL